MPQLHRTYAQALCLVLALAGLWAAAPAALALEAGAAKVEITPPAGTPLNGYGDRMGRPSLGVHDPLWARALYLDDGETRVFLVNTDLCMINRELRARVLELAPPAVPRENIILTATHTHNGPGGMHRHLPLRAVAGDFMPDVLEQTAQKIAQAMREAHAAKKRAAIGYATTDQDVLSSNRRVDGGPIDNQLGVIRIDDADGNALALVCNFAAHPTSVGDGDKFNFSADYCGAYYKTAEELSTPGCVAMFLNGAEGNQTIGNPEGKEGWERTESVGRLLAVRAKGVANKITCGEATLRLSYAEPHLPDTIASNFMPDATVLQTLEINDLVLNFVPGEPVVEIGQELRRRVLARGYKAQFTVGLANDYLMYFVPRRFYHQDNYETAQNYYGPGIEDWLYEHFEAMLSRAPEPAPEKTIPLVEAEEVAGGMRLALAGSPYDRGFQRGRLFAEDLRIRYEDRIPAAVRGGVLTPASGMLAWVPGFLDPVAMGVPLLAMAARPLLAGISEASFAELEGMAAGAGLPFDALWLLQHGVNFARREDKSLLFDTPLCTMAAALGTAAEGGLLVGRNLDWHAAETPVIVEVTPDTGHHYVEVGFTWNVGAFTGMNDMGLVVALERTPKQGDPPLLGPPIEIVLREALQGDATVDAAAMRLRQHTHLRGYHVLLAGTGAAGLEARVLEFGETVVERISMDGLLFGIAPGADRADADAATRYAQLATLLRPGSTVDRPALERVLADADPLQQGMARIWNEHTVHSVIFAPAARQMHVAFRGAGDQPGPYLSITLREGVAHE